jgi:transcriptional regulator with XRE-family HTH domain
MAKRFLIVNNQVVAAAILEFFQKSGLTQVELADAMKIKRGTVQAMLSGRSRLDVNRLREVCILLAVSEQQIFNLRDAIVKQVVAQLGATFLLSEFPARLKRDETILRTMDLHLGRNGAPWVSILNPNDFSSDEFMRARTTLGWSRGKTAEAFGVCEDTVKVWERIAFPRHREKLARKVFASVLKAPALAAA